MQTDYAGAGSLLSPAKGLALPADRWSWQPKHDGCYARISTDRDGRIARVLFRSGDAIPDRLLGDFRGLAIGAPDAILMGELEALTEAGERAAATRGFPLLHVFDAARLGGADISREPYEARHALLHDWQVHCDVLPERPNGHRKDARGRWLPARPRDVRRLPIVPLHRDGRQLWADHVERGGGEGLVAVRLDARLGARGGKRKIKERSTLDCVVVEIGPRAARLLWHGHAFVVSAAGAVGRELKVGDVVEVACDGFYEKSVTPRFARLLRKRIDLTLRH